MQATHRFFKAGLASPLGRRVQEERKEGVEQGQEHRKLRRPSQPVLETFSVRPVAQQPFKRRAAVVEGANLANFISSTRPAHKTRSNCCFLSLDRVTKRLTMCRCAASLPRFLLALVDRPPTDHAIADSPASPTQLAGRQGRGANPAEPALDQAGAQHHQPSVRLPPPPRRRVGPPP